MTTTITFGQGSGIGTPDWSSLQGAWDAMPATLTDNMVLEARWASSANEIVENSGALLDGVTPGAFTITIKPGTGMAFNDSVGRLAYDPTRGACIMRNSGSNDLIRVQTPKTTIENLMFRIAANYSSVIRTDGGADATTVFRNIIARHDSDYMPAAAQVFRLQGGITLQNFIGYIGSSGRAYIGLECATGNTAITNGVLANLYTGGAEGTALTRVYDSPIIKNVVAFGFATNASGTVSASSANNATDKASWAGTNYGGGTPQVSIVAADEFENITDGSEDFRLKSSSPKLKNNGTTGTTLDIFGTARSGATDIGAHESNAAGPAFANPFGLLGVGRAA